MCYGYDVVHCLDGAGEPVRGERRINEEQAEIVRRIFLDYADGVSPQAIAHRLNDDGVPGPEDARWSHGTIRRHAERGTGILNNELYIGRLVWNRQRYVKDPRTGRRVSRINPTAEWIITDVPDLRIVDDALWHAAKARQDDLRLRFATVIDATQAAHNRLNTTHRPRSLLSGLLFCGLCGGPYLLRGQARFACSARNDHDGCTNSRTVRQDALEARVLAGLQHRLMAPELGAEAVRAFVEATNELNRVRRDVWAHANTELSTIARGKKDIVTAIETGRYSETLMDRLLDLKAREKQLRVVISEDPASTPVIHPNVAELYARRSGGWPTC